MPRSTANKLLFCFANNKISGGNRILLEIANRQKQVGRDVSLFFFDGSTEVPWFANGCPLEELRLFANECATVPSIDENLEKSDENAAPSFAEQQKNGTLEKFDFIFASNVSLVPTLLLASEAHKIVLICQGYESYCFGESPEELFQSKPAIENILRLPIPILATSKSIQKLLQDKLDKASYLVPVAIDEIQFPASVASPSDEYPKRILVVGDHTTTFKGILDVAQALEILSREIPVQLVVLTQQDRFRDRFSTFSFPVEVFCQPPQTELASIYASCHAYCCGSWYEGFGLPCLEAFSVGLPVVSTNNLGVSEFGNHGENMMLTEINSPEGIANALRLVLSNEELRLRLVKTARKTLSQYGWDRTMVEFDQALHQIATSDSKCSLQMCNHTEVSRLLTQLEEEGFYTPPSVEQTLKYSSNELARLLDEVANKNIDDLTAQARLMELRGIFQQYLAKPKAHYYKHFKARFDFCQLLSSFDTPKDWNKIVKQAIKSDPTGVG